MCVAYVPESTDVCLGANKQVTQAGYTIDIPNAPQGLMTMQEWTYGADHLKYSRTVLYDLCKTWGGGGGGGLTSMLIIRKSTGNAP